MAAQSQESVALITRAPHHRFAPESAPARGPRWPWLKDGLYPGEPEACRRGMRPFLRAMLYFALLVVVFKVYRIEERAFQGRAFQTLIHVAFAALPLHYLAPYRYKRGVFVAASFVGLCLVQGLWPALAIATIACVIIACCRAPAPWIVRVAFLAGIASALAYARIKGEILPEAAWAILASMFLFRVLIYLYELKHVRTREPLSHAVSYFFLLPNFAFVHFPVVDYRVMERGYFAQNIETLHARGLELVTRGTIHLLLYRLVYHELLLAPSQVHSPTELLGYIACNYLLYLQVSGQFHIACGMLHLFGWKLPDTHHHYLLADGFTDYWRRINIYWKDFMVRLVWNPVMFALKRQPRFLAFALGASAVFGTTWFLHAYQSFWLRGSWGFTAPDAIFWGVLGVLVLIGVERDARRPAQARSRSGWTWRGSIFKTARVAGTFGVISLLWSLWSSPSVSDWIDLLGRGLLGW